MAKETPECPYCHSRDVRRDAVAEWDNDKQEWVLLSIYDSGWCSDCEEDVKNFEWRAT